jgi:glycosyltransferase involved in cell wall biosynthesis
MPGDLAAPKLLFVGAFPAPGSRITGGNISDCLALLSSSLPRRLELVLLDATASGTEFVPAAKRLADAGDRARRFFRVIHRERPDAVLLFASSGLSFVEKSLYVAYARALGIPSLLSVRSGFFIDHVNRSRAFRSVARLLLRAPARLLCQGERWQRLFHDTFGIPVERCPIVDPWVASEELLAVGRARRAASGGPVVLLFLGALERFKGLNELLQAVAKLRADPGVAAFELVVAGEGTLEGDLRRFIADQRLEAVVELRGLVSGEAKLESFRRADVFVLPSHTEGLPNAMIEAMAAGLACVVTPVGSVPDVIEHDRNGLLVTPRDPAGLEGALRRLIGSADLRSRLGAEAHRLASARFSSERAALHLERIVCEAVAGVRPTLSSTS